MGKFGWCGTCYTDKPGKAGYCQHHNMAVNAINESKASADQESLHNPDEFSRPTASENWGFCSENCLKLSYNSGYSEVHCL